MQRYDVRAPGPETPTRLLSGGNLQKVVLAREFESEPRVLVAASPTRGLDVGSIETVQGYLRQAAAAGVGVLLISEDLDEILTLADRIAVLYEGRVMATVPAVDARPEELGLLMAGVAVTCTMIRLERRLIAPRWLAFAVPAGSLVAAMVLGAIVLLVTGHNPLHAYRRLFDTAFVGQDSLSETLIAATPLAVHRARRRGRLPHEPVERRRRGAALLRRDRRLGRRALAVGRADADPDRLHGVAGMLAGGRLGADPGAPAGVRVDERDHHVADAELRRGPAADVPDLRQLLLLARHVVVLGARRSRRARPCRTRRPGLRGTRSGRSSSRSGCCSRSSSPSCSRCCARARGSASRCR